MNTFVYDKTDKGREEIATRRYHMPSKLRALLVMIDGRHSVDALMTNLSAMGLGDEHVDELLEQQYIVVVGGAEPAEPAEAAVAGRPPAPSARARTLARARAIEARVAAGEAGAETIMAYQAARAAADETEGAATPHDGAMPPLPPLPPLESGAQPASDDVARLRALSEFYTQTIKSTIGLRGILLQLKVEKAATIAELRELRLPYLQAVLKSRGRELTLSLRDRLDLLLGGKPAVDDFLIDGE